MLNMNKCPLPSAEFEMLKKMRNARNILAHWDILSYEQLKDIDMI